MHVIRRNELTPEEIYAQSDAARCNECGEVHAGYCAHTWEARNVVTGEIIRGERWNVLRHVWEWMQDAPNPDGRGEQIVYMKRIA